MSLGFHGKRWAVTVFAGTVTLIAGFLAGLLPDASGQDGSDARVVCTVNGRRITDEDVEARFRAMHGGQLQRMSDEEIATFREQRSAAIAEDIVHRILLLKTAREADLTTDSKEVDDHFDRLRRSLPRQLPFSEYLKVTGLTEDRLKKNIREDLLIKKLIDKQTEAIEEPTEEEVDAFFEANPTLFDEPEKVRARHILIGSEKGDDDKAAAAKRKKAEKIRKDLVKTKGNDFAVVAQRESSCPSKVRGGELGEFTRGTMASEFEQAAFSQKIGAIGPVVRTEFGYHIIQVRGKTAAKKLDLKEARKKTGEVLLSKRYEQVISDFIASLRAGAKITVPEQK